MSLSSQSSDPGSRWADLMGPVRVLVWLLIIVAVVEIFERAGFLVVRLFNVLLLFVFAAVVALIFTPVVDRMERLRVFQHRRIATVLALYAAGVAALAVAARLLVPPIVDEVRQLPALATRVQDELDRLPVHVHVPSSADALGPGALGSALGVVSGAVTGVVDVILIIVISIYFLNGGRELIASMRTLSGRHAGAFDFGALAIGATIASYVRGQLLMSLMMGVYTGTAMSILGVRYALALGAAAAVLEFLPIIGAPIAMVLAVVVAVFQSPGLAVAAGVAGLLGHALEAYVVGPRVNAHVVRLHPLVAMAALLLGAELAGVLGALFAVPIAAVVNIFLGALYRSRRGETPFTTADDAQVKLESLPRLGDEIRSVDEEGTIEDAPVPRVARRRERKAARR